MDLDQLRDNWQRMGKDDPLWAVSTAPQYKNDGWDLDEFLATGCEQITEILDHLDRLGVTVEHGRAFDFGCGVGRLTQPLAQHFDQVIGVDIAASMITKAQDLDSTGRCHFVLNESDDLSRFGSDSFDLVYSEITLLHMEPRYSLGYIREFLRIVKPGGAVVFQLPEPTKRQIIRDMIPKGIVYAGNRLRTRHAPMMEVYGVPRHVVQRTVRECGGTIVGLYDKGAEHGDRADCRYYITATPDSGSLLYRRC